MAWNILIIKNLQILRTLQFNDQQLSVIMFFQTKKFLKIRPFQPLHIYQLPVKGVTLKLKERAIFKDIKSLP